MNESEFAAIASVAREHWWYRTLHASVEHELPKTAHASVLDIGAGSGVMLDELRHAHPGWTLAGIEPSARGREVAAESGIHLDEGSYDDFGAHEGRRFDVILSLDSLYYLETDARIVAAAKRIATHVKDGGCFIGQVVSFRSLAGAHDAWVDCHRRFRGHELVRLFGEAGFEVHYRYRYQVLAPLVWLSRRVVQPVRGVEDASDLVLPSPVVNAALERLVAAEDALSRHAPQGGFGSSVFWVARLRR